MKNILEKIYNYTLEEIMGDRYAKYSKYIIQDRAIPDVRDGQKPVQRRILYAMYTGKNTYDKPMRKSAKTVGDVIGTLHPHGDSSVYDAMVRLSQDWKMAYPLVDMQGNNGSIDGDSPAAYRYTEARLSKFANELLKDIDKNTVAFTPNYDDTIMEPTVLPVRFPILLVNGTTGISAGYATDIPPHNLNEVIDATIKRLESPNCSIDSILEIIKGPDFPTGAIALNSDNIKEVLKTGRGKVVVRSKTEIVKDKNKYTILVHEIPYEVIKTNIVKKIDEIRIERKVEGIIEVRDESDKEGLRIAIDVKKEANPEVILNYLFRNTELQTNYSYNMVAIVDRRPKQLSVLDIIDSHIKHHTEVIKNQCTFDLETAKKRYHIVEGLIKAISILDEVVKTIRQSKNKSDAKDNLVLKFDFTKEQAEAIVMLQLYRLTNTDITLLEEESAPLQREMARLEKILTDEKELKKEMKKELVAIKKEYGRPRRTEISEALAEIKIDQEVLIPKEETVVLISKDGYIKRTSKRAYQANTEPPLLKENDYTLGLFAMSTLDTLLLFTNLGNYLFVPVYEIPDIKWKVLGKHISNLIKLEENEEIVSAIPIYDFNKDNHIVIASKNGMIKKTKISEFKVSRYSKAIACMKLKDDDRVINAFIDDSSSVLIATLKGYSLWFDLLEVPASGIKSSGVKSINLKEDEVVSAIPIKDSKEFIVVATLKGKASRLKITDLEKQSRAKRGVTLLKEIKSNPNPLVKVLQVEAKDKLGIKTVSETFFLKASEIAITERNKVGSTISKENIKDVYLLKDLEEKKDEDDKEASLVMEESVKESLGEKEEIIDHTVDETTKISKKIEKDEGNKSPKDESFSYKEAHQISLLEIDEQLRKIDEILK